MQKPRPLGRTPQRSKKRYESGGSHLFSYYAALFDKDKLVFRDTKQVFDWDTRIPLSFHLPETRIFYTEPLVQFLYHRFRETLIL